MMSSPTPASSTPSSVDENALATMISQLQTKRTALLQQKAQYDQALANLQSITKVVQNITTDNQGNQTKNMQNPIDPGTNATMTDARRLQIYQIWYVIAQGLQ